MIEVGPFIIPVSEVVVMAFWGGLFLTAVLLSFTDHTP